MTLQLLIETFSNFGFPIACVIALGWFVFYIVKRTSQAAETNMAKIQERSKEREDILYKEIKENREINAKAINTIAHYVEKLDSIQDDVKEIKTDITVIMGKN